MRLDDGTYWTRQGTKCRATVVLIHGLGLNEQVWQWTIPAISDSYDVITYDLFGHGQSGPPQSKPSLQMFSQQLCGLLDASGAQKAAIVGFSLGGMICRRFAQDHPDRILGLAILNSPHRRTKAAQAAILKRVEQARSEGPKATVDAALERWFTDDYRRDHPDMMALVRGWVLANDPDLYPEIYEVLATGIEEITGQSISAPALVLTGDEDYGNGPEMTYAIAAEIDGAEALILQGLRHMALVENPPAVNRPLRQFFDRIAER